MLTTEQTVDILERVSAIDGREVRQIDVEVWSEILKGYTYERVRDAVTEVGRGWRGNFRRIGPGDVVEVLRSRPMQMTAEEREERERLVLQWSKTGEYPPPLAQLDKRLREEGKTA